MESEQSQNFNERLSQWVANQGFWFQVRYSLTGSGTKGTAMFHLLRLGFRLLVFLLIVAAGCWIYLVKFTETRKFNEGLESRLQSGLSASEAQLKGFSRSQGELSISRLACQGGNQTFFTTLEARNIRCKMGLLDGVPGFSGIWDTGTVAISKLDLDLRAGADDGESARMFAESLFTPPTKVSVNVIEVAETNLSWGYSERTRGAIEGSVLKLQRQGEGLKLSFKGGTFSQNWLHRLEIVNLVVVCDRDSLTFEKAEFRRGGGTVDLSGLKVTGGERPTLEGTAKIRKLALEHMLPANLRRFIEGSISGDFRVNGSTNSSEGVGFEGLVTLDGQDVITLRKRIYLLDVLSVVDYVRNYQRVEFREGSLRIKTTGGGITLTDVGLKADDLFTLDGNLRVRLPTPEETKAAVEKNTSPGGAPLFNGDSDADDLESRTGDDELTLRRAADPDKMKKETSPPEESASLFDRMGVAQEARLLEAKATERMSRNLRYEGSFKISLLPDAFDTAPNLLSRYPVDPASRRIPLVIPIDGIIDDITVKQGEEIYQLRGAVNR